MRKLNIKPIFNVGYSPQFNPIEMAFSKVKRRFNASRLNDLVNRRGFNFDRTIKASFKQVTVNDCAAYVRKSFEELCQAAEGQ